MRARAVSWEGADDMAGVVLAPPIAGRGGGIAVSYELWRAHEAGGDA